MKQILFFMLLFVASVNHGQTNQQPKGKKTPALRKGFIVELFKQFDNSPDSIKKILIDSGEYTSITDGLTEHISLHIDSSKNVISLHSRSYGEDGTYPSFTTEYKAIQTKNNIVFIFSHYGGTGAFTTQYEFQLYHWKESTNAFELTPTPAVFNVHIKDFFFENTPDSVVAAYASHASNFFTLAYNEKGIAENILEDNVHFNDQKENKWLRGNTITFELKGCTYKRSLTHYPTNK